MSVFIALSTSVSENKRFCWTLEMCHLFNKVNIRSKVHGQQKVLHYQNVEGHLKQKIMRKHQIKTQGIWKVDCFHR